MSIRYVEGDVTTRRRPDAPFLLAEVWAGQLPSAEVNAQD